MTTWDQGGGCPCGVFKVCDCANRHKYLDDLAFNGLAGKNWSSTKMKTDFDFGFSTHKEIELTIEDKTKLYGLRDMILPLLNNLMANPDNEIIKWPNRKPKIEEFIKKMNTYIEGK